MDLIAYLESIEGLRSIDRTVSAQEVSPNDNGVLKYPIYFPPVDVASTKLSEIIIDTYRPTASRREWNGPERYIPLRTPSSLDLEMIPIGSYFTLGEKEIQRYEEISGGDEAVILRLAGADVNTRTDGLVEADYRRVEVDAHTLWATGRLVQDDPQTGRTVETNFGFDADRLQDASGTPWDGTNFYANLVSWLTDGKAAIGGTLGGVMLSEAKRRLVKASFTFPVGVTQSYAYIEAAIADELGVADFRFVSNDDTLDLALDGGTKFDPGRVWPVNHLAAIPADGRIGRTARAPIAGLGALARQFPGAQVNRNGALIAYDRLNSGKGAKVRSQLHHMSIPNERRVWTINTGTPA
jgi:hypothetical protein